MRNWLSRKLAHTLFRRIRSGSLTVFEDGRALTFGKGAPRASVEVRSTRAWSMLLRGSNGLAEAYARKLWDSPDAVAVVRVAARNAHRLDRLRRAFVPLLAPAQRARTASRRNTRRRCRRDIASHYDLGNELFELMLDPSMTYSCALFARPDMSLHEASLAKLEQVCEKLDLRPEDHVLEIGSGWGAFAVHAARTRGCCVTTTTISREQHRYALEQVRCAGLEHRVEVLLEDYRDLRGSYDKLVSIEMIEAVGWRHFETFFTHCSNLLVPEGAMLLQAIALDDRAYEVEKASRSFMNTYIFPNGCLPSMRVIARCVKRHTDMSVAHVEDITGHYVHTLRAWRANFERNAHRLAELGYDERFRRIWTLYLAYSEAGFAERRIRDVQLVLAKPEWPSHLHGAHLATGAAGGRALSVAAAG
jgi:cyclopropane-fatty-acyl-phospholipid synthase